MTEAQIWYCIIAGSVILFMLAVGYGIGKENCPPCNCKKKAKEMLDE